MNATIAALKLRTGPRHRAETPPSEDNPALLERLQFLSSLADTVPIAVIDLPSPVEPARAS